jgi:predicted nuclease of predicted toxin-antitoxin system
VKLLLDENISPKVAEELARVDGLDACHVRDRGLLAATDAEVLERAYDEDRVLVTANVGDFLKLARARDVHPGIVLLEDGALQRAEQLRILRVAAAAMAPLGDLINKVVWVAGDGSTRVQDIPPP